MNVEKLQEDWVKFQRIHCTQGHIDVFISNSSDNPNEDSPRLQHTNGIGTWYRLNSKEWIPKYYHPDLQSLLITFSDIATANEIWDMSLEMYYEKFGNN